MNYSPFVAQEQPGNKWGVVCNGAKLISDFPNSCLLASFDYDEGKGEAKAKQLASELNQTFVGYFF